MLLQRCEAKVNMDAETCASYESPKVKALSVYFYDDEQLSSKTKPSSTCSQNNFWSFIFFSPFSYPILSFLFPPLPSLPFLSLPFPSPSLPLLSLPSPSDLWPVSHYFSSHVLSVVSFKSLISRENEKFSPFPSRDAFFPKPCRFSVVSTRALRFRSSRGRNTWNLVEKLKAEENRQFFLPLSKNRASDEK